MSTYTLSDWSSSTRSSIKKPRSNKTILVATPVASPGYTTNSMIYIAIPFKLRTFADNEWVAPPAKLLLPLMVSQLERRGYFTAVVTPPFTGLTDFRLSTQLLMLRQEFLKPISCVHLMAQATLLNAATHRVIVSRLFDISVPAPDNNPYGGVLAANKAALQLTAKMAELVINSASARRS